jgi:hypothetical protein
MTSVPSQDEDPININEEELPPDAEDFLCLGGGGRGYVEHNPPKTKPKAAKSFEEKREDEKVRWPDSYYDDSDEEEELSPDDAEDLFGLEDN